MAWAWIRLCVFAKGDYEVVVFILIGVVWLIANLLKKASQSAKGPGAGGPQPHPRPQGELGTGPAVPSLRDFLKRLGEVAQEEQPRAPQRPPRATPAGTGAGVRTPPPPRRAVPKQRAVRPVPARRPAAEKLAKPEKPIEAELAPEISLSTPELLKPKPGAYGEPSSLHADAYAIKEPLPDRITEMLGTSLSGTEIRKGIILAEILGRPKALKGRRSPPRG